MDLGQPAERIRKELQTELAYGGIETVVFER